MELQRKNLVYLADDHALVAQGIASLLKQHADISEVKVFPNGKELVSACFQERPDFIFLDIDMPVWDGRVTLEFLAKDFPKIPVLMLSMLNEKTIIDDCIQKGALAFMNKDCSFDEIQEALMETANGNVFYSKEVLKVLAGLKRPTANSVQLSEELSDRELEILRLLCDGFSPKEIADQLFISHRTVETHKNNIMQKFQVNSIAKLISLAIKSRMI